MSADATLYRPGELDRVRSALRSQELDGWLLVEFHGNNPVATTLLGLEHTTRRSFVLLPADGEPAALIHAIEESYWRRWPWEIRTYSGWREMEEALSELVSGVPRLAMEVSPRSAVPTLDLVPGGLLELIRDAGVTPVSSGELVTRFHAVWTPRQLEEHRKTASILSDVAAGAFRRAAAAVRKGRPTNEGALSRWILDELEERGVILGIDCIVAAGENGARPHYVPVDTGAEIPGETLLLVDLWGRPGEDDVFADQTWMGWVGTELPPDVAEAWTAVRDARDAVISHLEGTHARGGTVRGMDLDDVARSLVEERGFGRYFVHRTGHSIDTDLHGSGPNLDNLETRDERLLVPGVGFSVEPGVYIPGRFGIRSEINVFWGEDGPEVTPSPPQREIPRLLEA